MSQNIFAVVLAEGHEKVHSLLLETYPNAFQLINGVILVACKELTSSVASAAALTKEKEDQGVRGAVFKLNGSYTGFTRQSLWEWLENAESDQ